MTANPDSPAPIEIHLRDGEHLVISVAEGIARREQVEDAVLDTILETDGDAADLRRAITERVAPFGLVASEPERRPGELLIH